MSEINIDRKLYNILTPNGDYVPVELWTGLADAFKPWIKNRGIKFEMGQTYILKNQNVPPGFGIPRAFYLVKLYYPVAGVDGLMAEFWESFQTGKGA